ADTARFAMPLARIGLAVPVTLTWKLVEVIGAPATRELLFTGEPVGAEAALALGLVNRVVAAADLDGAVTALARQMAHHPPLAVLVGQAELERAFQRREPLDAGRGQVGRTRWCAHAETGPDERFPVGAALRQPDERRPRRGALDVDVLAFHVHVPRASGLTVEDESQRRRSEERRVGKEWRSRGSRYRSQQKHRS